MDAPTSDIAFTSAVQAAQTLRGSRASYERLEAKGGFKATITPDLEAFLAERESFYLGTASADGQPYIQHRGGPKGFLKVLDETTLAFADFGGNRQYITVGTLEENDKAFIFLMDYPNRRRIKVWGTARYVEDDAALLERLADPAYKGKPERAIVFTLNAWDVNCPQHITPRYTLEDLEPTVDALKARIDELETELAALKIVEH